MRSRARARRAAAGLAALALAGLALAGCGSDTQVADIKPAVAEVDQQPQLGATPAQAALSWWNALRSRDAEAVVARLTPAARAGVDLPRLRRTLHDNFGDFTERTEATVLYSQREHGKVKVYMRLEGGRVLGSRVIVQGVTMLALPLVSRDGVWLIENSAWLRQQSDNYAAIKKFNEKLRREALERAREAEEGGN
jgi:hypothetical protein